MKPAMIKARHLLALFAMLLLLTLPLWADIHHLPLFFAFASFLIILNVIRIKYEKRLDEDFYRRWQKQRSWGFWPNMVLGTGCSMVFMAAIISIGQFFGQGLSPVEIVGQLSNSAIWAAGLVLLFFGILAGAAWWHDNEKRYNRIYYTRKYSA